MKNIMSFRSELKEFVEKNPKLVMRRATHIPGIYILKYSREAFFKGIWSEFLKDCRGAVVDADYNVVSLPFTKIHNYGIEKEAPVLDDSVMVNAYRKINGFMVAATWHNDDLLISTTGSIASEFVEFAMEMIPDVAQWKHVCSMFPEMTFMFECVHKFDPHIIVEKEGMYLIGYRKKEWQSKVNPMPDAMVSFGRLFQTEFVESMNCSVGFLKEEAKKVKHEGFVAYTSDGIAFKIKSPYYISLKAMARKKDILQLDEKIVDEEFFPVIRHVKSIGEKFNSMNDIARLSYMQNWMKENYYG